MARSRQSAESSLKRLEKALSSSKTSSKIPREEWDFSHCPPDEREECFLWELARESVAIKQDVVALHDECDDLTFDNLLALYGTKIFKVSEKNSRPMAIFYFCPEFPRPYLSSMGVSERKRRILAAWGDEGKAQAHLLDVRYCGLIPADIGSRIRQAIKTKGSIYRIGSSELVLFNIDWHASDMQQRRFFDAWLKENRPRDIEQWPDRGHGLPHRKRAKELKEIGALRLLRRMSWKVAAEMTAEVLGKPLFSEQSEWMDAEVQAARLIRSQEDFSKAKQHGF